MTAMWRRRVVSAGMLFLLAFSSSARAYCPMRDCGPQAAQEQPRSCHGAATEEGDVVKGAASDCCHSQIKSDAPATARPSGETIGVIAAGPVIGSPAAPAAAFAALRPGRFAGHSPPLTILRI
jgi:hypothetical protein